MAMMPLPGRGRGRGRGTRGRESRSFSLSFLESAGHAGRDGALASASFLALLDEFTAAWDRGDEPDLDDYLSQARPDRPEQRVELIYRAYRLAQGAGLGPSAESFLGRYPDDAPALGRLLALDEAFTSSHLRLWT